MDEYKEMPLDDSESALAEDSEENTIEEIQRKASIISSEIYNRLGIIILILTGLTLIVTILTYIYPDAWSDETLLLIERIIGFVLVGVALIVGIGLLIYGKKLQSQKKLILEAISTLEKDDNFSSTNLSTEEEHQ